MGSHFMKIPIHTEQEAVDYMAKFLVRTVGWSVVDNRANSSTDRDIVLSSSGEPSTTNHNTRYIRFRGTSNDIVLFTYETYPNFAGATGEVSEPTYGLVNCAGICHLTVVADLERVFFHIEEDTGERYFGYIGRIDSYYDPIDHPYPNLIKGMQQGSYDFFYTATPRNQFMRRQDGTISNYVVTRLLTNVHIKAMGVSSRDGTPTAFQFPISFTGVEGQQEYVGHHRGIYALAHNTAQHGDFIKIKGRVYYVFQANGDWSWCAGPVSSNNKIPSLVPAGLDLVTAL